MKSPFISVVSPVYSAEKIVDELVGRIETVLSGITENYEIVLVEDCGPDKSWEKIIQHCARDQRIKGVKFSRNFGQHFAVSAGVKKAKGENIVLLDCDLQDDPADILKLLEKRKEGFDIVYTKRYKRKHSLIKRFNSYLYNKLFALFSEKKYDVDAGSLVLFSRKVAKEFNKLKEKERLYIQLLKFVGFPSTVVVVEHQDRFEGESSYNFFKLMKLGLQGWTSHSNKLLKINIYFGLLLSFLSFCAGIFIIVNHFLYGYQIGWPSVIVTILFSTGILLLSMGIMGIYIGKIFDQSKDNPLYIIEEEINIL